MIAPTTAARSTIPNTHQPRADPLSEEALTGAEVVAGVAAGVLDVTALGATTAALDVAAVGVDVRGGRAVVVAVAVTVAGGAVVGGGVTAALFEGCGCEGSDLVGVAVNEGNAPAPLPPPHATAPPSSATTSAVAAGRGSRARSRCTGYSRRLVAVSG